MARGPLTLDLADNTGLVVSGATATIKKVDGTNATLYAARTGGTTAANPLVMDANGQARCWVDRGLYRAVYGGGITRPDDWFPITPSDDGELDAAWASGIILPGPYTIDVDPLAIPVTQTNWATLIRDRTLGSGSGTTGGTGLLTVTGIAHGIGELPDYIDVTARYNGPTLQVGANNESKANVVTATTFEASLQTGAATTLETYTWMAHRLAGPAMKSTGAQNAQLGWDIVLNAGTWTIELLHNKGADRGIYTVALDGAGVGTIDGYAAADTPKQRGQVTGVVVAVSGKKRVTLTMATKNASSSSFTGHLAGLRLLRTA